MSPGTSVPGTEDLAPSVLVGGVNSPIRARVKPKPFFTNRGKGALLYTRDGRRLVDYVLGYGPLILGHAHPRVLYALARQLENGWLYGTPHELEVELASRVLQLLRPGGRVRFVNSGTEAVSTALRLARGVTRREKILVFKGSYHGAVDYVLASQSSEPNALMVGGIPRSCKGLALVARFNDVESVKRVFEEEGDNVAAVLVEPVMANHGLIPAEPSFLEGLRRITARHGSLLVFDEVVTGFRIELGGAQEYYGVRPDLTVLGKVLGGGLPIGALVGSAEVMENLTPAGRVFSAGTFNGHPLAMAAGLATLEALEEGALHRVHEASRLLARGIREALGEMGLEWSVRHVPGMMQLYFTPQPPPSPEGPRGAFNEEAYSLIHERMLAKGVFIPPSQREVWFTSSEHAPELVMFTVEAFKESLGGGRG